MDIKNIQIKLPLSKPYFDSEDLEEIQKVLRSGWVTMGPKVKELEDKVAGYLGISHAVAVTNCTSALHLALLAIGIKSGDEVLVPDYTFPATAHAVLYCNAKPVFVDINPKTYNVDPDLIEGKITKRTKAIIVVHTFGQPAEMERIMKIAGKHNLKVIEDAACALGAKCKDKFAGTIGNVGCFSFHGRKSITTGEGGMVVTSDRGLAEKVRSLSVFGKALSESGTQESKKGTSISEFTTLGYNYKMSDIAAALGIAQLKKLDKIVEKRQYLAKYWDAKLKDIELITTPYVDGGVKHIYQSYVVLLDKRLDRNRIIKMLAERGIQTQIGTYALHAEPVYSSADVCANSLDVFKRALSLPMYYALDKNDIDIATEVIKDVLKR
ncbi:DegT/DnrJ/EryC1/StrS family aminotransferase [Candidatus Omnitrophota bacterium]